MGDRDDNTLITQRITYYLKKNDLTENRLSQLSGVTQSTLNGIMNKGRIPRVDTIASLCKGLNISLKEFFDFPPYNEANEELDSSDLTSQINYLHQKMIKMENDLKNIKK